jgi:cbb3-type cytochrome oxidase subunit 3
MRENSIREFVLDFGKNMKSLAILSVIYSIGVVINFFAIFSGVVTFFYWPGEKSIFINHFEIILKNFGFILKNFYKNSILFINDF